MNPFSFCLENDDFARKFSKIGEVTHIIGKMFIKMLPKSGRIQAMFANVDKSCRSFFFCEKVINDNKLLWNEHMSRNIGSTQKCYNKVS